MKARGRILFVCSGFENIGIEYLSSYARSRGYETGLVFYPATFSGSFGIYVPLLDRCTHQFKMRLLQKAFEFQPDIIAFPIFSHSYKWSQEIAAMLKRHIPVPIIAGGPHSTSVPERVIEAGIFDAIIVGEGEGALIDIMESLRETGTIDPSIQNVLTKESTIPVNENIRGYIRDLDSLPHPDKDLFSQKVPSFPTDYMIMTSRGCPYACRYCINSIFRERYSFEKSHIRRRSPENVIEELLEAKKKYSITRINFQDDVFIFDQKWLAHFIPLYKDKIDIPFICYGHPTYIKEDTIRLIVEGGCVHIRIGVQSVSPNILRNVIHRVGMPEQVVSAGEVLHRYKLHFSLDHMFGFPYETIEDLEGAALLYNSVRPSRINSYWLTYFPGTEILRTAREAGLLDQNTIRAIEEGELVHSFNYPSSDYYKNKDVAMGMQILFDAIPFLSQAHVAKIVATKKYMRLPKGSLMRQFLQLANDIRIRDTRALVMARYIVDSKRVP